MSQQLRRAPSAAKSYQENYIDSLRQELLYLIERELTPLAIKYGYSDVPLESKIKWKPMVLILGNYSSGKSTLINEFVGAPVQLTGQAPTDDSFTVITGVAPEDCPAGTAPGAVLEERGGKVLLNDDQYPFDTLRQHGERFAAHFRLKKVNSKTLQNLAIIDTPGMLDSVAERDRGYQYQQVIGDLAQLADLVLVLFDPHKAGTVRESYASLRHTLPEKTFEDRVIFVLNRVDECGNLEDLLRTYGTLCWNLSQMTGRKDIPRILLTYSPAQAAERPGQTPEGKDYLRFLENQRLQLQQAICDAPRHRLDHLAGFLEFHSERLAHMLEALYQYARGRNAYYLRSSLIGLVGSMFLAGLAGFYLNIVEPFGAIGDHQGIALGLVGGLTVYLLGQLLLYKYLASWYQHRALATLDDLTPLTKQSRRDSWQHVRGAVEQALRQGKSRLAVGTLKKEWEGLLKVHGKGAQEIRTAINEATLSRSPELRQASRAHEEKSS